MLRNLRLLLVHDTEVREDHAVVAARLHGRWLVLDNRRLVLLEDAQLAHYMPIFAIDDRGVNRLVPVTASRASSGNKTEVTPLASDPAPGAH